MKKSKNIYKINYLLPNSSESVRSLTDFLGLGAGTGGRTTGGHMPGFSAALFAAVTLIAVIIQLP